MKKLLMLFTIMIGMIFVFSACGYSNSPIEDIDTPVEDIEIRYVINYYDGDTLYSTQDIKRGETTVKPDMPTKDGFTFEYWTKDSNPFIFNTIIYQDIELHAIWKVEVIEDATINLVVTEDGLYTSKDEVALYIATYHKLPSNYMTKSEADGDIRGIWTSINKASIGGDIFYNREGLLPIESGITYTELDINFNGGSRGALRIVYSSDFRIFYTDDHYDSFVEYDKETREWKSY